MGEIIIATVPVERQSTPYPSHPSQKIRSLSVIVWIGPDTRGLPKLNQMKMMMKMMWKRHGPTQLCLGSFTTTLTSTLVRDLDDQGDLGDRIGLGDLAGMGDKAVVMEVEGG